jgi:DNA polymerase-3 subunit gamma/tau
MNDYVVTARKWRPMKFDDVVGQDHITATLRNAIGSQRTAHAYLFSGPRGVGKTTVARLLAKAVNCLAPQDNNPDNACEICTEINEGRSFAVIEIDGASNRGVEEIRNLRESTRYPPAKGTYKVYIIDEVHMLTKEAFNALLKTLEEPPPHVLFIFATTEIQKVPLTIVSRCQRFEFRRIAVAEIMANLREIAVREGVNIDEDALRLIARKGEGSIRDAQGMFDQVVSLCGHNVTLASIVDALNLIDQEIFFRVTDLVTSQDTKGGLTLVEELVGGGHDIKEFLAGLLEHLRNLLITKVMGSTDQVEASDVYRKRYAEDAAKFSVADLLRMQRLVSGTEAAMRDVVHPRFRLEADMIQLISMHGAAEVGELLEELEELKGKMGGGGRHAGPGNPMQGSHAEPAGTTTASAHRAPRPSPPRSSEASGTSHEGTPSPGVRTETPPGHISVDEVASRWREVVSDVRSKRPALGSVLESAAVVGIQGSVVRIACADEFGAATIRRHKDLLSETLSRVLQTKLRVEVELHGNPPASVPSTKKDSPATAQELDDEHPVIKALRREFGAEPL